MRKGFREVRVSDLLFLNALRSLAILIIGIFVSILIFLAWNSRTTWSEIGFSFLKTATWSPTTEHFGVLAFAYGTAMTSLVALLISVPISIGAALFLTEIGPKFLRRPVQILIELLAAIPSVVYGLWGIFVLAPIVRNLGAPYGLGIFTASLILAIMVTPTITSVCVEIFKSVPRIYREGALALGSTQWETLRLAVLGPSLTGIISAVILGLGRAMGETMAVTMVIGNRPDISWSLFSPGATMSSVIANEYGEANLGLHLSSLTAVGLTLLFFSLIVNSIARFVIWRAKRGWK